ncbi:hypothetical protein STRDD11_00111 [Streptococcus sp. DD11]|nr:hypothetical protein STRDD11_00111 [Streptococcus sp. DD11]
MAAYDNPINPKEAVQMTVTIKVSYQKTFFKKGGKAEVSYGR